MKRVETIKRILAEHKPELVRRFHVKEIGIFGSYVRNEHGRRSDVDILVGFSEPIGLFAFMDLEEYLQDLLGVKVDLVSRKSLKPPIGDRILQEVSYV